jgi:hypothetical protein
MRSVEASVTPKFIEGFVEECMRMGLGADATEDLFQKHAYNSLLTRPTFHEGFRQALATYKGPLTKSAMAKWLTPEVIAMAEEARLYYGDDALSHETRVAMGAPEPSWDTVPLPIKEAAAALSQQYNRFDHMPMNQKVLIAALLGGGMGGASRLFSPTQDDQAHGRGAFNRLTRGALRGGAAGAGAGVGATVGGQAGGMPGAAVGGLVGGLGAISLAGSVIS